MGGKNLLNDAVISSAKISEHFPRPAVDSVLVAW